MGVGKIRKLVYQQTLFRVDVNSETDNLITKILENCVKVIDIGEVKDGIIAGHIKDLLFINKFKDKNSHKLYFGKNISRYKLTDTDLWVDYDPERMMKEEMLRVGNTGPGLRMRDKKIFEREKIIYRKIGKEIIATYSPKGMNYWYTIIVRASINRYNSPKLLLQNDVQDRHQRMT